ncbi:MAG: nucleotidyltransferase domain-containing protein [Nanoarchaeota archaeon]|nr:nucleotidyltransferase domain-containing protein [Nanoarchaeota archaeon]
MFKELNTLKIFLENPTKGFSVRESARILKKAPATISKELKKFAKQNILQEQKIRGSNIYKANLDSELFRDIKIFYTITKIKQSKLIESLNQFYGKPTIILFGSGAHGLDTETSDYDLVIISEKRQEFPEKNKYEKLLKKELNIFLVKSLKNLKNDHLVNSVLNGTVLQGEIKWI